MLLEVAAQQEHVQPRKDVTITYKTRTQKEYARLIETKDIVFAIGSAGTGKTFLAAVSAVQKLTSGEIERIVVCRPAIPAGGEQIGFLPGEINDKMMPYLRPVFDAFRLYWPQSRIKSFLEYGQLEIVPLAFMRGRTFTNTFVICDEMQNSTVDQLLMILTRLGEDSKMVLTGDPMQSDVHGQVPCFEFARRRLSCIANVGFVDFTDRDVVRHKVVERILHAWRGEPDEGTEALPEFIHRSEPYGVSAAD